MADKARGIYKKYHVTRTDGKPVVWAFVLEDTDPLALPALWAYAAEAERMGYCELARDLKDKTQEIPRTRAPWEHLLQEPEQQMLHLLSELASVREALLQQRIGWTGVDSPRTVALGYFLDLLDQALDHAGESWNTAEYAREQLATLGQTPTVYADPSES